VEDYEIEVLVGMYERGIFRKRAYKSIQKVSIMIKWEKIARKCRVKKSFKSVIRSLVRKGLVDDQGKSCRVCSLTQDGIVVADQYLKLRTSM